MAMATTTADGPVPVEFEGRRPAARLAGHSRGTWRASGPGRGPSNELPRERLLAAGTDCLSDAELLALSLRTGGRGCDATSLARRLLDTFGGLRAVLDADPAMLLDQPGLGPAKVAALKASVALADRYDRAVLDAGDSVNDAATACRYLRRRLGGRRREVFACLFLDSRNRVLGFEELFFGSIDKATVHPRELISRVLAHNAAALILAHNHPSGVAEPSGADIDMTRRLAQLLNEIDVRVIDHVVVGPGRSVSFAERRLL